MEEGSGRKAKKQGWVDAVGKKEVAKIAKIEMIGKIVKPVPTVWCKIWITIEKHQNRLNAIKIGFLEKTRQERKR